MPVTVLRLGHRKDRDARISTHCGLTARALGAKEIVYSGEKDGKMMKSVLDVTKRWGGPFYVRYEKNVRKFIKNFKGIRVHLSMYGEPLDKKINNIRKKRNVLIIVGGEKVPGEIYHLADLNIAIGNQPHSEIASLSITLHEYFKGRELNKRFTKAKIKIIPQERGKKVIGSA